MKLRRKGLLRLWVVVSTIAVPSIAFWFAQMDMQVWNGLSISAINFCVEEETNVATHPNATECIHRMEADKSVYEREHTTPLAYWSEALLGGLVVDLLFTGTLSLIVYAVLWVRRGFREEDTVVENISP